MRIFVTAGNTQVPIDRVRCITNIFTGRTGASIALEAYRRGHHVTLATSHPETIDGLRGTLGLDIQRWHVRRYRTFEELETLMEQAVCQEPQDAVVHCAAVSDYLADGIFAPAPGTTFRGASWQGNGAMRDRSAGKVKSDEPELWLRLVRAPKLVDKIRNEWNFHGTLVKFKLEVGVTDAELLEIAEKSRRQSQADWMVANTLDGAAESAYLGNGEAYRKITRDALAASLLDLLEVPPLAV